MILNRKGNFMARAVSWAWGETQKGTPQIELEFDIEDDMGRATGEQIRAWLYFATEKNSEISFKQLEACGWTGEAGTEEELPGMGSQTCELWCDYEEWQGKSRLKVKSIRRPGERFAGAGPSDKQTFFQNLRRLRGEVAPKADEDEFPDSPI